MAYFLGVGGGGFSEFYCSSETEIKMNASLKQEFVEQSYVSLVVIFLYKISMDKPLNYM